MENLLIQNATIATSTEVFFGDILVENEKISKVGEKIPAPPDTKTIDATGKILLPGGVDSHTHFDFDIGFDRTSDDFYTGTVAAAIGGTTTVIDHLAFGPKNCRLTHQPEVYHRLTERAVVDYGFHGVIQHVDDQVLEDMRVLRDVEGISSFRVALTTNNMLADADLLTVFNRAKELGLLICAHCENDAMVSALQKMYLAEGNTTPRFHPLSRPAESEEEAVFRVLMLAQTAGDAKVNILRLSTRLGLNAVHAARRGGQENIFVGTCPQYLLLEDHLYETPNALQYIVNPPLRKSADTEALWNELSGGAIDTIGSDHRPFFFAAQKCRGENDFTMTPQGLPGVELRMALLFSEGYCKKRITLQDLVRQCCTRPAEIFGIAPRKGDIRVNLDADFVLFDPEIEWRVEQEELHENVDYTPYDGMLLRGKPVMTISRGEIIVENGEFLGSEGRGQYLHRREGW